MGDEDRAEDWVTCCPGPRSDVAGVTSCRRSWRRLVAEGIRGGLACTITHRGDLARCCVHASHGKCGGGLDVGGDKSMA